MARPRKNPDELHVNAVRILLTDEEYRDLMATSLDTDTPPAIVARRALVDALRKQLCKPQAA